MKNPYDREKIQCVICRYKIKLDYKNVGLLSQFVSSYSGKPYERHITRLCRKQHEILQRQIDMSVDAGKFTNSFCSYRKCDN